MLVTRNLIQASLSIVIIVIIIRDMDTRKIKNKKQTQKANPQFPLIFEMFFHFTAAFLKFHYPRVIFVLKVPAPKKQEHEK